jgi:hypothetical protein
VDASTLALGLQLGLGLCAWMTLVIVGSLRHDPYIWQADLPAVLQERLPPVSAETMRRKRLWGALMIAGLALWVAALLAWTDTPLRAAVATWLGFQLFNLFDALVIDVGLILLWAPPWAVPAEVRGHPALRDPRLHVRNYLLGALGGTLFAAMVAGLSWLV